MFIDGLAVILGGYLFCRFVLPRLPLEYNRVMKVRKMWLEMVNLERGAIEEFVNIVRDTATHHNLMIECWKPPFEYYFYAYINNEIGVLLLIFFSYLIMLLSIYMRARSSNYIHIIDQFRKEVLKGEDHYPLSPDFIRVHNTLAKSLEIFLKTGFEDYTDISQFNAIKRAFTNFQNFADHYGHFKYIEKMNYLDQVFVDICLTNKYLYED